MRTITKNNKTRGKPGESITSKKEYISKDKLGVMRMLDDGRAPLAKYLTKEDLDKFKTTLRYAKRSQRHLFEARFDTSHQLYGHFQKICKDNGIPYQAVLRDFMLAYVKANGTKKQLESSIKDIDSAKRSFMMLGRIRKDLIDILERAYAEHQGISAEKDLDPLKQVIDATADVRNAQRTFILGIENKVLKNAWEFAKQAIDGEGSTSWEEIKKQQKEEE